MPYIKLRKRPGTSRVNPMERAGKVMRLMLWPYEDQEFRASKRDTIFGILSKALATELLSKSKHEAAADAVQIRLKEFADDPISFAVNVTAKNWFPSDITDLERPLADHVTAGFVALTAIGFQNRAGGQLEYGSSKASLYLSRLREASTKKVTLVPKDLGEIGRKWTEFRQVAHFWAAYMLMSQDRTLYGIMVHDWRRFMALSHKIAAQLRTALPKDVDFWLLRKYEAKTHPEIIVPFDANKVDDFLARFTNDHSNGPRLRPAAVPSLP